MFNLSLSVLLISSQMVKFFNKLKIYKHKQKNLYKMNKFKKLDIRKKLTKLKKKVHI